MDPVTGLSLGRIAVGIVGFARPELLGDAFGVDTARNRQAPYVTRLFAAREVALGAVTVLARGTARRNLVAAGVAVDLGDAVTGVVGVAQRTVPPARAALLLAPAVGAVVVGVRGLRRRVS